jgi:hypothetical protein
MATGASTPSRRRPISSESMTSLSGGDSRHDHVSVRRRRVVADDAATTQIGGPVVPQNARERVIALRHDPVHPRPQDSDEAALE